jgi:hypothetical protein
MLRSLVQGRAPNLRGVEGDQHQEARMSAPLAPEPLTPPDCDLRDFGFMPLDVRRLLTSETWIEAADDPKLGHALICL